MKTYELTYIISSDITSEEAEASGKEIETLISANEGIISKQEKPSAKTLSYPIKKHGSGFVGVVEFQMPAEKLNGIEEKVAKDGKIIRHMVIIKKPANYAEAPRMRRRIAKTAGITAETSPAEKIAEGQPAGQEPETTKPEKKVELKDIEEKLDEILGE